MSLPHSAACVFITVFTSVLFSVSPSLSQAPPEMARARLDLAVPDAPAFKILDVEPSEVMRPGTLREVAVTIGNVLANAPALPRSFALELAPRLLFSNVSLQDYRGGALDRFLYRLRLSAASSENQHGGRSVGLGVRMTFLDESDLRNDRTFEQQLIGVAREINALETGCAELIPADAPFLSDEEQMRWQAVRDSCRDALLGRRNSLDQRIADIRDEAKAEGWNKAIIEAGLALRGTSDDSLAKDVALDRYGVWLTAGLPLSERNGQLLLGIQASTMRGEGGSFSVHSGSLSLRGYYGENGQKGYLEAQWLAATEELPSALVSLGGEMNLTNGFWVDVSAGLEAHAGERRTLRTSLNFRLATPESQ